MRVDLDMAPDWSADGQRYLARVTKARILEAVGEAAGPEAAARLEALKKPDMVAAAEPLMEGTGWLPPLLRTRPEVKAEALEEAAAHAA